MRDITLLNGFIQGGVTNNGAGVYSGSGFGSGIAWSLNLPANVRISGVSVSGCLNDGIYLYTGDSTVVESCTVRTVGGFGIYASTIQGSTAVDCGSAAITGDQVSDSRGRATGSGTGVAAATAQNCHGWSGSGTGVDAQTAENCFGFSGSGTGVNAVTAQNCYGYSTNNGIGLSATVALNCSGYSETGGYGLTAATSANNCYGYSPDGTALRAFIANSCRGVTATGTNQEVSFKYNMP